MMPIGKTIYNQAYAPYEQQQINTKTALKKAVAH
jgi:flagellar biosynthesis protein FliP